MTYATQTDKDWFQRTVNSWEGFGSTCGIGETITPYTIDPIPPINAKGGRDNVEGWTTVYEAIVGPKWCNGYGSIHGACVGWIVDNLTGLATEQLQTPTWWGPPMSGGVSLAIDLTYFNPAPMGSKVRIVVTIDRMSGTLANAHCHITDWDSGKKIASGTHLMAWRAGRTGPDVKNGAKL